ncbi:MAG: complex I NDUFA9 subunit family protein [Chloroflexota bacterium]|nr:complex I NDUFA9 subunit family protein [Chloroflexota bacterium]
MATILLTGASGFVGSAFLPALIDAGHTVHALVRSDASRDKVRRRLTQQQGAKVKFHSGDVTRPDSLGPAMAGVDTVIHLVAIPRDMNGGKDLTRVNTVGTANVVDAMRAAGVQRMIHQGALGVTDDPSLHYGSSKARAEKLVAQSDLDWTILKPSLLFGARDGFFNVIADLVRPPLGAVPIPARQRSRFQPLWVGDLARIVVQLLERPDTVGRTFELGGPDQLTYREMVEEVIRATDRRRVIIPVPLPLIKLVARGAEMVRLPFPVASDQLRQLAFDNVTVPDAVESAFGFRPRPIRGNLDYLKRGVGGQDPPADSSA